MCSWAQSPWALGHGLGRSPEQGTYPSWPGWEAPWDTLSWGSLPVSLSHSFPVSVPSELSVASFKLGPGSQWEKGAWACPSLNPMSE